MSIYAKLAKARVKLQKKGLNKTGRNRNFNYFELKDFLPEVNRIFDEIGLCSVVSYTQELATLTIYDSEKNDSIVFSSPMVQKALPTGTEIQNLGAIQTYQRRYLYLTALEIAENDAVDCLDTSNETPKQKLQGNYNKSTTQNTPSTPPKSTIEQLKAGLKACKTRQELDERYAKQLPWLEKNHPELIDSYNSYYDERLFNLTT